MRQIAYEDNLGTLEELDASRQLSRVTTRRIPYDYVAIFRLTGKRGNTVSAAINISAEAAFTCTTIGYSLEEPEIPLAPPVNVSLPPTWGIQKFSPQKLAASATTLDKGLKSEELLAQQTQNLRDRLSFRYAIIDKGSGRELQNTPVHNMAGLGRADGERPFRELAVPYVFAPNSSISIELYEIVTIPGGTIYIDFQGYKEFR